MAAVALASNTFEPSENWDDDFEFNPTAPSPPPSAGPSSPARRAKPRHAQQHVPPPLLGEGLAMMSPGTRISIASSEFTMEDWDAESQLDGGSPPRTGDIPLGNTATPTRRSPPSSPQHHQQTIPMPISMALAAWSEDPQPKTPVKGGFPLSPPPTEQGASPLRAENWDDDFEDSPGRKQTLSPKRAGKAKQKDDEDDGGESWDEEFAAEEARLGMGPPPPASRRTPRKRASFSSDEEHWRKPKRYSMSEDGDFYDSDEDGEFGFKEDEEEDRTVTARSRKSLQQPSPPPPVPRLPTFLAPAPSSSSPRPFPRSPTSSVFSVPTTLAETRSYTSTTHLKPSISRGSSAGLSHLPPSPPIHKDRERRRLRKKSRPVPATGVYELSTYPRKSGDHVYPYSFSDGELEDIREREREKDAEEGIGERILPRLRTPSPPPPLPTSPEAAEGQQPVVPATPSGRGPGALLSRIGSVTSKWGAGRRRRRGSSMTPSEVASGRDDAQLTPRPQSSMSSLHPVSSTNTTPPVPLPSTSSSAGNWFFRSTSGQSSASASSSNVLGGRKSLGTTTTKANVNAKNLNGSVTDLNEYEYDNSQTPVATPSKLVKRKSLGFVQLRRYAERSKRDEEKEKGEGEESSTNDERERVRRDGILADSNGRRPMSMVNGGGGVKPEVQPRHASYTYKEGRDRKRSYTATSPPASARDPFMAHQDQTATTGDTDREDHRQLQPPLPLPQDGSKEKETTTPSKSEMGLRSIMGNVRKLSIVGRHKRTKSSSAAGLNGTPPAIANVIAASSLSSSSTPGRPLTPSTSVPHLQHAYQHQQQYTTPSKTRPSSRPSGECLVRRSGSLKKRDRSRGNAEDGGGVDGGETVKLGPGLVKAEPPPMPTTSQCEKTPEPSPFALLPPIELQPPSPPRNGREGEHLEGENVVSLGGVLSSASAADPNAIAAATAGHRSPGKLAPRSPHSPGQSASLGRASPLTAPSSSSNSNSNTLSNTSTVKDLGSVIRRNSLGDLKIPARISQAQVSLRRDLGMVREFAAHVESLKTLQDTYAELSGEVHALLDRHHHAQARQAAAVQSQQQEQQSQSRATSPLGFFNLANLSRTHLGLKARKRSSTITEGYPPAAASSASTLDVSARSPTFTTTATASHAAYKELATALYTINSKYRISLECAELLIELGGGSTNANAGNDNVNVNTNSTANLATTHVVQRSGSGTSTSSAKSKSMRERAITLAGDDRPPTPVSSRPGSRVGSYSSAYVPMGPSHSSPTVPSTVTSPPMASPSNWRASTGRHDLSQRQLTLLKEMLNNPDHPGAPAFSPPLPFARGAPRSNPLTGAGSRQSIAEEPDIPFSSPSPNREWTWGNDAMNSTMTLPASDDESGVTTDRTGNTHGGQGGGEKQKKKKLMTMSGFRDMLRALRKGVQIQESQQQQQLRLEGGVERPQASPAQGQQALLARTKVAAAASTTSLSAGSSYDGHSVHSHGLHQQQRQQPLAPRRVIQKRRPKSSSGPGEVEPRSSSTTPYSKPSSAPPPPSSFQMPIALPPKSPRRPSLASIFRLGSGSSSKKGVPVPGSATDSNASTHPYGADSGSSCPEDDGPIGLDDGDREEEDWDQIDSASDLDGVDGKGLGTGVDTGATIRGASAGGRKSGKRKMLLAMGVGGGNSSGTGTGSGKRSPYLQQDPYAFRSASGLGRRTASGGGIRSASSTSVNASQTSLVGSVKIGTPPTTYPVPTSPPASASSGPIASPNTAGSVRQPKLSDVQENAGESEWPPRTTSLSRQTGSSALPNGITSRSVSASKSVASNTMGKNKTGSVRSMPPQPFSPSSISSGTNFSHTGGNGSSYPDIKLIFTPENIRPLLENAREVQARLKDCVEEMRVLLQKEGATLGQVTAAVDSGAVVR